jgi:F-type H+-transporting ATPase subunit delta
MKMGRPNGRQQLPIPNSKFPNAMPDNEFEIEQIGEVYAQALLNLARQRNAVEEIADDVHGIGELLKVNAGFAGFVHAATISPEDQMGAMTKIFGGRIHQLTLETLKSMARRSRLMFLRGMVEAWDELIQRESNHLDVEVTTAVALPEETLGRIRDAVGRATDRTADMTVKTDASIIGGMKVRVGDTLLDASVESQLGKIHERIKREGMTGIQKKFEAIVG